jgi:SAM-dependent methyltransferase
VSQTRELFSRIYSQHAWGGESRSGHGSNPRILAGYLTLLRRLLAELGVRSVVDVGCGDWSLASTMDWSGISYTGIDVVPELIDHLNGRYLSDNVRFVCADAVMDDLPHADLCIAKDVLQHLSNASVQKFLSRLERHFECAVITNDITHTERAGWRRGWKKTCVPANIDISDSGYRPLRLTGEPFDLHATRLALFPLRFPRAIMGTGGVVHECKEVLLWKRAPRHNQELS